jgi:trimeric autotransporter adhesin
MALTWEKFIEKLLDEVQADPLYNWPIGSIYMSVVSTSPATLFGGTWSALEGRMLIGADGTYAAGSTGGSSTHSHTLENGYAQMQGSATNGIKSVNKTATAYTAEKHTYGTSAAISESITNGTQLAGSTDSANGMPPYLSVYMWKRTA